MTIKKKVVHQQPVSVAIQANLPSFQLYKSGVYSDPLWKQLDHGVFGCWLWSRFFHNMDYWIVKNSWVHIGVKGYIRIQKI